MSEPAEPPRPEVQVKGITGTLNKDDVHQTMEARQPAFDACIAECRRRLRWVSGEIRFAFKVGADGSVAEVHALESTLGHRKLEHCLLEVMTATVFPRPAGRATAEFQWGLTVDPASGGGPELIEAEHVEPLLRRKKKTIFDKCEVKRRERFQVTAYLAKSGQVLSSGAVPHPPSASEKVECVLEELAALKMPKPKRHAKVTFELR